MRIVRVAAQIRLPYVTGCIFDKQPCPPDLFLGTNINYIRTLLHAVGATPTYTEARTLDEILQMMRNGTADISGNLLPSDEFPPVVADGNISFTTAINSYQLSLVTRFVASSSMAQYWMFEPFSAWCWYAVLASALLLSMLLHIWFGGFPWFETVALLLSRGEFAFPRQRSYATLAAFSCVVVGVLFLGTYYQAILVGYGIMLKQPAYRTEREAFDGLYAGGKLVIPAGYVNVDCHEDVASFVRQRSEVARHADLSLRKQDVVCLPFGDYRSTFNRILNDARMFSMGNYDKIDTLVKRTGLQGLIAIIRVPGNVAVFHGIGVNTVSPENRQLLRDLDVSIDTLSVLDYWSRVSHVNPRNAVTPYRRESVTSAARRVSMVDMKDLLQVCCLVLTFALVVCAFRHLRNRWNMQRQAY